MSAPLLEVRDLRVEVGHGARRVQAVRGVDLTLARGETLGLVGESGSGKSTLARALMQLLPVHSGTVQLNGQSLTTLSASRMRPLRRQMQMVFQDPSLNPRQRAGDMLAEVLHTHDLYPGPQRAERVRALLQMVGLSAEHAPRYPHALSGGQKQRLGIARALAVEPQLIVADEPLSALDVSISAQIVNLLVRLRDALGLSMLFISHDLEVVEFLCDRVMVMYLGRVMEVAPVATLFARPTHPYTQALLAAAPQPSLTAPRPRVALLGEPPSPVAPPSGCVFRTRCPKAQPACAEQVPVLQTVSPGHQVACPLVARPGAPS